MTVYAMRVKSMDESFLEEEFRERRWVGIEEAMTMVGRKELQPMIAKVGKMLGAEAKH